MVKQKTRTYILQLLDGGKRKLTIPATWKITFGNVLPFNKTSNTGGAYDPPHGWESRIVLRVYEKSKDNLRAVMHDVLSFHEENVILLESRPKKVTTARLKEINGKQDVELKEVGVDEWFNPDQLQVVEIEQKGEKHAKRTDR